jgi:hypothetical protein
MTVSAELHDEILECLRRSGYLLESRLVRSLSDAGFFVEPNVAIADPRTGKSREIDLSVEFFDYETARDRVSVKTHFTIETINNNLPLILMTPHPGSPNEDFENYLRYGTTPEPCSFLDGIDLYEEKAVFGAARFSQYCGLSRKKSGEALMASHLEDLYSSLQKLAEFVEQEAESFGSREWDADSFWRLWFWQGILVVGGELLVVSEAQDGSLSLTEAEQATLIFNFHVADQPRSVLIHTVREGRLLPYLNDVVAVDRHIATRIRALRSTGGEDAQDGHS